MAQHFVDSLTLSWRLSSLTSTLHSFDSHGTRHGDDGHTIKTIPYLAWLKNDEDCQSITQYFVPNHPNNYLAIITTMIFVMVIHAPQRIITDVSPDLSRPSCGTIRSKCSLHTLFPYKLFGFGVTAIIYESLRIENG